MYTFLSQKSAQYTKMQDMVLAQKKLAIRAGGVTQWFSSAFSPGPDPGDPGLCPTSGSLQGACFSLCLCLCLSLSLSLSLCLSLTNK